MVVALWSRAGIAVGLRSPKDSNVHLFTYLFTKYLLITIFYVALRDCIACFLPQCTCPSNPLVSFAFFVIEVDPSYNDMASKKDSIQVMFVEQWLYGNN